jgi:23S rRNA pseudouridine2605 synthase
VRTRVLMDQLGPALIAEAKADFSSLRREEEREHLQRRDAADAPPPKRGKPIAGKRKHVSTLRAEQDKRATGERVRTERSATEDRRGRTVRVERVKAAHPKAEPPQTRNGRRFRAERAAEGRPDKGPARRNERRFDKDRARPQGGGAKRPPRKR